MNCDSLLVLPPYYEITQDYDRYEVSHFISIECCPQPEDSFFQLINKERLCLKEQICKELSRSYKDLAISARVENKTAEWETSSNPAERVLDAIKASHPKMKLKEFDELLLQMKRLDIVELIQNHHLFCSLCERNRFDSRA